MKYVAFYKPYGVLSQFTGEASDRTLAEFNLPKDVYAAGRLDKDSEGLLLLTDDGPLIKRLLEPKNEKVKTYWVQVENIPTKQKLRELEKGVVIQGYKTLPCQAKLIDAPQVPLREPPIRERKNIPTAWIEIRLIEGKNRQVRRMSAAIGHPTLRLIRYSIGKLTLAQLTPGQWCEIDRNQIL